MSKGRSRGSVKGTDLPVLDEARSPRKDSGEHAMWRETYSIDGKRYFYHIFSRESQWHEPDEPWEPARVRNVGPVTPRSRTTSLSKQAAQAPGSPRVPRFPVLSGQSPGSPRLQRVPSSPTSLGSTMWQDGQPATPRSASSSSLRSSGTLSAAREDVGLAALLSEFDEFSQEFLSDLPGSSVGSSPISLPRSSSSPTVSMSEVSEPRTVRGASVSIGAQSSLPVSSGSFLSSPSMSRGEPPPPAAVPNKAGSPYRTLPSPPTVVASSQSMPVPALSTFTDRPIGIARSASNGSLLCPQATDISRRLSADSQRTAPLVRSWGAQPTRLEDRVREPTLQGVAAPVSSDDRLRSASDATRLEDYLRRVDPDFGKSGQPAVPVSVSEPMSSS
eukprot:TRINITY_DN23340_c0_g1_i1.p1 TRINITY_DN23340_c0_g1~~TRINITY_DN23340_c0_g1_i1.p1  ORF type:complete len:388 (+),score=66.10 TRINITY_DN23340_c0_g1_i1:157-1320(+)